ncbi:MAG: PepSY domain-containing protein [Rhodobacteraceae bacterium]|nr:PepSY domain-containing protein [Paracoccaceae bacterium]
MVTKFRGAWLWFHRWFGIVIGILIAVLGLSGSILIFESELDRAFYPELLTVTPGEEKLPIDEIVAAAGAAHPGWTPYYFERSSDDPTASYMVVVRDADLHEQQVFVDPYTGRVLGERSGLSAVALVRRIHGDFVLGPVGENIVGGLSFVLVIFFVAGFVLWWPNKGGFKRALTVSGGDPKKLMRELHNVFGAWLGVFFISAALTVPPLVWMGSGAEGGGPPARAAQAQNGGPASGSPSGPASGPPSARPSGPPPGGPSGPPPGLPPGPPPQPINWQQAAEIAAEKVPGQYLGFELRNEGARGIYMVRFWPPGDHSVSNMTNVLVTMNGGRVIRVQGPEPFSPRSFLQANFSANIHSGAIAGLPGRLVMFAAGLCFPVLFVTGVILWLLKRRRVA